MSKSPARRPNKKGTAPAPRRAGAAVAAYVPSTVDAASSGVNSTGAALVRDIGLMIESARNQVAQCGERCSHDALLANRPPGSAGRAQGTAEARVLRGNVPRRGMEHPCARPEDLADLAV